ncbi:hypothetical protein HDU93_007188 [Gonapodya sp. JEL0774]|nr:hypothetical protein HDU93_007188 [Gonapodya sp. JEL0774]
MGRTYSDTATFEYPWEYVTRAVFQKYPNPFATHVLTSDVVDRWVDETTGVLHSVRVFIKTNSLPKWAKPIFPYTPETYVIELSTVDPSAKEMRTRTWNLTHTKMMRIEESQIFRPSALSAITSSEVPNNTTTSPTSPLATTTTVQTHANIESHAGSGLGAIWLRNRIESFGVGRFEGNTAKSRRGLLHVLSEISPAQPSTTASNTKEPLLSRLSVSDTLRDRTKKIAAVVGNAGTTAHPVGLTAAVTGAPVTVAGGVGALVAVVGAVAWFAVKVGRG